MSSPQRIFVTGVSSSMMSGLVNALKKEGHKLVGLSRKPFVRSGMSMIQGDLGDPSSWKSELEKCTMVIHAAAVTHCHDESQYYKVNFAATKQLLDACPPQTAFVYISSRAAGKDSGAYGHSKWQAEEYLKLHRKHYLILSPSEVFGTMKLEGIESLIQDAMHKKLIPYPAGLPSPLSPIHVDDLTRHMRRWIFAEEWPTEAVVLNGPEKFLYPELIQEVALTSGNNPFLIPIPKLFMNVLAKVAAFAPGKLPFTSDQVARLYAPKSTVRMKDDSMRTVKEYVQDLMG